MKAICTVGDPIHRADLEREDLNHWVADEIDFPKQTFDLVLEVDFVIKSVMCLLRIFNGFKYHFL